MTSCMLSWITVWASPFSSTSFSGSEGVTLGSLGSAEGGSLTVTGRGSEIFPAASTARYLLFWATTKVWLAAPLPPVRGNVLAPTQRPVLAS